MVLGRSGLVSMLGDGFGQETEDVSRAVSLKAIRHEETTSQTLKSRNPSLCHYVLHI